MFLVNLAPGQAHHRPSKAKSNDCSDTAASVTYVTCEKNHVAGLLLKQ